MQGGRQAVGIEERSQTSSNPPLRHRIDNSDAQFDESTNE